MSDKHDFIVKNGVLIRYRGPGGDVWVPAGVKGWERRFCGLRQPDPAGLAPEREKAEVFRFPGLPVVCVGALSAGENIQAEKQASGRPAFRRRLPSRARDAPENPGRILGVYSQPPQAPLPRRRGERGAAQRMRRRLRKAPPPGIRRKESWTPRPPEPTAPSMKGRFRRSP